MDTWMSQHFMCTNTRVSTAPQQAWAGGEGESLAKKQEEDPDLCMPVELPGTLQSPC